MNIRRFQPEAGVSIFIPKFGFREGLLASLKADRRYVFQGELLQLYVVIPKMVAEKFPWLKVGQPEGVSAWDSQFAIDIRLRDTKSDRSALAHFHAESHSSPGCADGAAPPSKRTIVLENGDVLVALETIISISNAEERPSLSLEVSLLQPAPSHTQALYKAFESSSNEARMATLRQFVRQERQSFGMEGDLNCATTVTVIQLLRITTRNALCGGQVGVSITVSNQHPWIPVSLLELSIHSPDKQQTKDTASGLDSLIERFDKSDLPVLLAPCESYNFVFFVTAANCAAFETGTSARQKSLCTTRFTVTWKCNQMSKPVMLQQNATWSNQPKSSPISLTLQVKSPVCVNREFALHCTVVNNDTRPFNFTIVMLPPNHPCCSREDAPARSSAPLPPRTLSKPHVLSRAAFSPLRPTSPALSNSSSSSGGAAAATASLTPSASANTTPKTSRMLTPSVAVVPQTPSSFIAQTPRHFAVSSVFSPTSPAANALMRSPFLFSPLASSRVSTISSCAPPSSAASSAASSLLPSSSTLSVGRIDFGESKAEQEHSEPFINFSTSLFLERKCGGPEELLCLEFSAPLGVIDPTTSKSATLNFIAVQEGLLVLSNLFLFDEYSRAYYRLRELPSIFARHTR